MPRTARPVAGFRSTGVTLYGRDCVVDGLYATTGIVVLTCTVVSAATNSWQVCPGGLLVDVMTVGGCIRARTGGEFMEDDGDREAEDPVAEGDDRVDAGQTEECFGRRRVAPDGRVLDERRLPCE